VNILVLICGNTTLGFQLISTDPEAITNNADRFLARGIIQRIGGEAVVDLVSGQGSRRRSTAPLKDIRAAIQQVVRWLTSDESGVTEITSIAGIHAVGHRVMHGGEHFSKSVLIDDEVIRGIEDCIDLAPLHNPGNVKGIIAAREIFGPGLPQVAVFDTAFHQTLPERAFLYALPYQLYRRHRIRRYGFHGNSHRYVAYRYRQVLGLTREQTNVIALHLGQGCSAALIQKGDAIDTSMGLTPLEGLVMGTRSGDLDPAIVDFISAKEGLSIQETESLLNNQSGLLGISGLTDNMPELLAEAAENNDRRSRLAIEIFCYRVRKYIGAYLAAGNGSDAIIFAGGIGENSPEIRSQICDGLQWMGLQLDDELNRAHTGGKEGAISKSGSKLAAYVIPTNEELLIARDTLRCVLGLPQRY